MISTTAACGWMPRAPYLGGPLDGTAAPPLRRKAETVHPTYRTAEGKAVRGEVAPDESHYAQRDYDVIHGIQRHRRVLRVGARRPLSAGRHLVRRELATAGAGLRPLSTNDRRAPRQRHPPARLPRTRRGNEGPGA